MAAPNMPPKSSIKLNNGVSMPRIHLGVYMTSGRETKTAVTHALGAGYRAVDSAEWYANEAEVGSAILDYVKQNDRVKREDVWFTTKLKTNSSYEATRKSIKESIRKSGLGHLDLYLLHSPYGGKEKRAECWRAVCDAVESGEVRAGGVSNFGVRHLEELLESNPKLKPAVNQIEVHPFNTQTAITTFCEQHDILIEAYAPLARALRMKHPKLVKIAQKHFVSPAQVLVRWSWQKGYVPLPKSTKKDRIAENADIGGFEIDDADMKVLDGMDEKLVTDWDPTDAD